MSKIVSLFAPPVGADEPASGSSGKKARKSNSLTKEEPLPLDGAVSGASHRKKKGSFMDHLLSHGENLSPPVPPATISTVFEPVKKGSIGKTDRSSVLTPVSGAPLKKDSPSSGPLPSFVLSAHESPGASTKSGDPQSTEASGALLSPSVTGRLSGKKGDPNVPVPETGKTPNAESGEIVAAQSAPSEILSQTSVAEEVPGKVSPKTPSRSFSDRPVSPFQRPLSQQTASVDGGGQKTTGEARLSKDARLEERPLKVLYSGTEDSAPRDPFHEKEIPGESSILPERKIVSTSSRDTAASDEGAGERGTARDFPTDIVKPSETKSSQSAVSAASASNILAMGSPDTLQPAVSDSPAIDQREMFSKVVASARHGGGEISLRVHPPALGPIRIQVHVDPRTREVEVRLFAKDESIGDLLRSKSQDLKGALSREGFTMHQFHVDGGSGDLPVPPSLQMASSGFSSGGDSSSGSSQGSGAFLAPGQGEGSPNFTQGGDGSRDRPSAILHTGSGTLVSEEPSYQPADRIAAGDLSGFHRVV